MGVPWRWLRDFTKRAGVPIWHVGAKSMISAVELMEALRREGAPRPRPNRRVTQAEADIELEAGRMTDEEHMQWLREELGMRLKDEPGARRRRQRS